MSVCKRNEINLKNAIKSAAIFAAVGLLSACGDSSSSDANDDGYDESAQTLTDIRDGQVYRTVKIGSQVWMAENLNYETENSCCNNDSASYCAKYGRLYTWAAAVNACPKGWHLPDTTEWNTLFDVVRPTEKQEKIGSIIANRLKSTSGWNCYEGECGNGSDDFGFTVLPAGFYNRHVIGDLSISYSGEGSAAVFWCSTQIDDNSVYHVGIIWDELNMDYLSPEFNRMYVRCIKD